MIKNICHSCKFHEKCMDYRYENIKLKFMEEIETLKNKDGNEVIYVQRCSKFIKRRFNS